MKKVLLILLLFACCQYGWASEIRDYTLNQMQVTDDAGKVKVVPILTLNNKPKTIKLIIAGLGSNRITAQCPIYSLSVETQIYPLDKNITGTNGSEWYYITHSQGVTIIELMGDNLKVYNLGAVPYTYVGIRNK